MNHTANAYLAYGIIVDAKDVDWESKFGEDERWEEFNDWPQIFRTRSSEDLRGFTDKTIKCDIYEIGDCDDPDYLVLCEDLLFESINCENKKIPSVLPVPTREQDDRLRIFCEILEIEFETDAIGFHLCSHFSQH